MKPLFTGGMAVLVTMLEGCPDASHLVCQTLFRLTVFHQLPDQQVRLFLQLPTCASSLSWTPVYVDAQPGQSLSKGCALSARLYFALQQSSTLAYLHLLRRAHQQQLIAGVLDCRELPTGVCLHACEAFHGCHACCCHHSTQMMLGCMP